MCIFSPGGAIRHHGGHQPRSPPHADTAETGHLRGVYRHVYTSVRLAAAVVFPVAIVNTSILGSRIKSP